MVCKNATDAVKKFHEMTNNKIRHISEFVELTYPPARDSNNCDGGNAVEEDDDDFE